MQHYLHLYHYKTQFEHMNDAKTTGATDSENSDIELNLGTVFDETLSLYKHMRTDLVRTLSDAVVHDVAARSRPYRKERQVFSYKIY